MTGRRQFERASRTGGAKEVNLASLRRQIASALGGDNTVTSIKYLGRDAAGRATYRISYRRTMGSTLSPYQRAIAGGTSGSSSDLGAVVTKTLAFSGGKLSAPRLKPPASAQGPQGDRGSGSGEDKALNARKDYWMNRIQNWRSKDGQPLDAEAVSTLSRYVDNFNGSVRALDYAVGSRWMNLTKVSNLGPGDDNLDGWTGWDDGSGSWGDGWTAPEYVKPDRRVVEDMAKGMQVSLIGTTMDALTKTLADAYMADHRKNFDNPNEEIDPSQTMLETLRDTETYQTIHQLRPESADERTWISERRSAAEKGGLNTELLEEFAIEQATVGGDVGDIERAAGVRQTVEQGTSRGTLLGGQLREVATSVMRGIV